MSAKREASNAKARLTEAEKTTQEMRREACVCLVCMCVGVEKSNCSESLFFS